MVNFYFSLDPNIQGLKTGNHTRTDLQIDNYLKRTVKILINPTLLPSEPKHDKENRSQTP